MSMLCSGSSHLSCSYIIQDYLEKDGRALAHDYLNLYSELDQRQWAQVMDHTRHSVGNDRAWGDKKAVTYQHFIVSPNPEDNVGLDTLRALTTEWAREFFGDGDERGALGNYEVSIVYHDDNKRGIPHAHVIVNNTDLDTLRRLQISNTDNGLLEDRLQDIAKERGLSYFDNTIPKKQRRTSGVYRNRAEREIVGAGKYSWLDDLRNRVDIAERLAKNPKDFPEILARLGVEAKEKNGDFVYSHASNPTYWKAFGYRLGRSYTKDSVEQSITSATISRRNPSKQFSQNIEKYAKSMGVVARADKDMTLKQVVHVLRVNDKHDIKSFADYESTLQKIASNAKKAEQANHPLLTKYQQSYQDVLGAAEIAAKGEFFLGIEPSRKPAQKSSAASQKNDASGAGSKKRKPQQSQPQSKSRSQNHVSRKSSQRKNR